MKKPAASAIFKINSKEEFEKLALEIFFYQVGNNKIYGDYLKALDVDPRSVKMLSKIPFLPIEFFKTHKVVTSDEPAKKIFTSSGTTGSSVSKHFVTDLNIYEASFLECFNLFYGNPDEYCILALLPSYKEREDSSLVYMTEMLIKNSGNSDSGFYLSDYKTLANKINELEKNNTKTILLGVSYALLDLVEQYKFRLKNTIVMETGGMKGRRKEMIREELHAVLKKGFGIDKIHSEYGMTELLSQAYSNGEGIYYTPPWMKILIRDVNDPFNLLPAGQTGGMNIIDLANVNSCSFIATQDLGKTYEDNSFEVLGRFDNSDIRGCNLMIS